MVPAKVQIPSLLPNESVFVIPFYQRAYVWTEKYWQRFLRDMEYITKTPEEYFIGSVILKKLGLVGRETARWSIVDGQQRLTTLAVFYKVLSLKNPSLHNPFDKRFRDDDGQLTIKHSLNDKEAFEKIADLTTDIALPEEDSSNLIKAYNYFRNHINIERIDLYSIQQRLWFIAIYLENEENEHKIFDTINSIGMSLNTEELMKNHLFNEESFEEYKSIWRPVFEKDDTCLSYWKTKVSVSSSGKKSLSDRFFHTLLQIIMCDPRNKVTPSEREEFRTYDTENEFSYFQSIIESGQWGKIEFAKLVTEYASLFKKIYSKATIQQDSESFKTSLKRLLLVVFSLDVHTAIPYILYVLKNVSSSEERDKIFNLLECYIVRRQICNKVCKNYSDLFAENLISQQVLTSDSLCNYLRSKKPSESLHMPYDSEVQEGFKSNSNLTSEKARCILYLLESKLREIYDSQTPLYSFSNYTLEHLMPQKWEENWKIPSGLNELQEFEFRSNRNKVIGTLGNMAIITQGLNSTISNYEWSKKLLGGLEEKARDLITMKDVICQTEWNEASISLRGEWLAEKANDVWLNVISVDEKEEEQMARTLDHTQYSFGGGPFTSKSEFVPSFVRAYTQKHPKVGVKELKQLFPDKVLKNFKRIGFICTEEDIQNRTLTNGRKPTEEEKDRWYHIKDSDAWIPLGDGTKVIVSGQITKYSADYVKSVAEDDGWTVLTSE